jgi:para-aminobenzoate synthetase component 1
VTATADSAVDDLFHFYAHLRSGPRSGTALLESLGPLDPETARYSLVGAVPIEVVTGDGPWLERLDQWCPLGGGAGPQTGAIGYVGYHANPAGERRAAGLDPADVHLVRYGAVLVHDRISGTTKWAYEPDCEPEVERLEAMWARWREEPAPPTWLRAGPVEPEFTTAAMAERVRRTVEHIKAGDIYQANITGRFSGPVDGDLFAAYAVLREATPNPFFAFLDFARPVLSTSPERFFQVTGGRLESRPIKGTARRVVDGEDQRAALLASAKDRAENTMIVDVVRNDLGRVCKPGSVRAERMLEAKAFNHLYHLESTVTGGLADGARASDVLGALFPAASITGAPKVRAMEVIDSLEDGGRGPYCGAIGFFGSQGWIDTSVAIRIAYASNGRVFTHAGGGIVADSSAAAEADELALKAEAVLDALARFEPR